MTADNNRTNTAPADVLRRAAALMRERAEAGRDDYPWYDEHDLAEGLRPIADITDNPDVDAAHIASWHPAVAVAVADLLDEVAEAPHTPTGEIALAVAHSYLGEEAA